jgi:hypothetical protein
MARPDALRLCVASDSVFVDNYHGGAEMTADNWLFILVMGIIILTAYLTATAPKITEQERKEMEEEWWD